MKFEFIINLKGLERFSGEVAPNPGLEASFSLDRSLHVPLNFTAFRGFFSDLIRFRCRAFILN